MSAYFSVFMRDWVFFLLYLGLNVLALFYRRPFGKSAALFLASVALMFVAFFGFSNSFITAALVLNLLLLLYMVFLEGRLILIPFFCGNLYLSAPIGHQPPEVGLMENVNQFSLVPLLLVCLPTGVIIAAIWLFRRAKKRGGMEEQLPDEKE